MESVLCFIYIHVCIKTRVLCYHLFSLSLAIHQERLVSKTYCMRRNIHKEKIFVIFHCDHCTTIISSQQKFLISLGIFSKLSKQWTFLTTMKLRRYKPWMFPTTYIIHMIQLLKLQNFFNLNCTLHSGNV